MLIIREKGQEEGAVTIRKKFEGDKAAMSTEDFVASFQKEIAEVFAN